MQRQFDIPALASGRADRAAAEELYDYVEALLDQRRREPGDDLISALLAAEAEGDRLSDAECVNLVLERARGRRRHHPGPAVARAAAVRRSPGSVGALAPDPGLVPRPSSEVLRFEPITPFTARICLEPIEYRGVMFPAGTIVADLRRAGQPGEPGGEDFDITADRGGRVLTFGAGPHFCLAQPGQGRTRRGARLPRAADAGPAPRRPAARRRRGHLRHRVPAAALGLAARPVRATGSSRRDRQELPNAAHPCAQVGNS